MSTNNRFPEHAENIFKNNDPLYERVGTFHDTSRAAWKEAASCRLDETLRRRGRSACKASQQIS